jgi:hypothetical protein
VEEGCRAGDALVRRMTKDEGRTTKTFRRSSFVG